MPRRPATIAAVLTVLAAAGCGGSGETASSGASGGGGEPTAGAGRAAEPAPDRAREVIAGWADTLRRSDVDGATRFFGVPLIIEQGGDAVRLSSPAEVRTFNAGLPCGARLTGVTRAGGYVIGSFLLGERPGKTCDAPGKTARVAILVKAGKIREWRQIPEAAVPEAPPADAETT